MKVSEAMAVIKRNEIIDLPNHKLFEGAHVAVVWYPEDRVPMVCTVYNDSAASYKHCAKCGELTYSKTDLCHKCK